MRFAEFTRFIGVLYLTLFTWPQRLAYCGPCTAVEPRAGGDWLAQTHCSMRIPAVDWNIVAMREASHLLSQIVAAHVRSRRQATLRIFLVFIATSRRHRRWTSLWVSLHSGALRDLPWNVVQSLDR
jgi:C4-dicarboxylate-specific signal transduction histidine kinase